jgi:hypothetical protein
MKKLLPVLAAGAAAAAIMFAPTLAANAAPAHAAKASSKHYTLSVAGNGKHATVVYTTLKVTKKTDEYGKPIPPKPVVHTIAKAHEPWTKHVTPGADLYEIAAIQTTGSKLSCTIKNTHGTVIAHSESKGRNTIVTCIVAKDALLAGVGGSGTGTGSSASAMSSKLLLGLR